MSTVNSGKIKKSAIFFGSPNNRGNTAKLLDEFLRFCPENTQAKLLCAYDLKVEPCIGCDHCKKTGVCFRRKNDAFHEIEQAVYESDNFIIATPVYFLGVPAPLKQIFDRFQPYFYHRSFDGIKRRKAVLLTTSGSNDSVGPKQVELSAQYVLDTINVSLIETVSVKQTDRFFEVDLNVCRNAAKKLFSYE